MNILKKGLHSSISVPTEPSNWVPPAQKLEKGEPAFASVDNPGGWSQYTVRPKFETKKIGKIKNDCKKSLNTF